jgi:hypothetical protein
MNRAMGGWFSLCILAASCGADSGSPDAELSSDPTADASGTGASGAMGGHGSAAGKGSATANGGAGAGATGGGSSPGGAAGSGGSGVAGAGAAAAGAGGAGGAGASGSGGAAGAGSAGSAGGAGKGGVGGQGGVGMGGQAGAGAAGQAGAGGDPNVVKVLGQPTDPVAAKVGPTSCAGPKQGDGAKTTVVPSEFLARVIVEATGALPGQATWNNQSYTLYKDGCSAASLQAIVDRFKSKEFQSLPYSIEERGSLLFRAALGREIDAQNLKSLQDKLAADPDGWCGYVSFIESTFSFFANVDDLCSTTKPNYHFEKAAPIALHGEVDEKTLQKALSAAKKGQIVELSQASLVVLHQTLVIPPGVTLRTRGLSGEKGRATHGRMARLVRGSGFSAELVRVREGAAVSHLFLDGRRTAFAGGLGPNVFTDPSTTTATEVSYLRSDNPAGAQNLRIGSAHGTICTGGAEVWGNLVLNSANDNRLPGSIWSDGIFVHCENANVHDNEILDASDVALIAFVSENGEQHSVISENRVLLAGNDAFGGLVVDPWTGFRCGYQTCDFSKMRFEKNILWTGTRSRFVFGISTSSSPWSFISDPDKGKLHGVTQGGSFVGNHSGSSHVRLQNAIYVANMKNATVTGNWNGELIDFLDPAGSVPKNQCPKGATIFNGSKASGTIQAHTDGDRTDCLLHGAPPASVVLTTSLVTEALLPKSALAAPEPEQTVASELTGAPHHGVEEHQGEGLRVSREAEHAEAAAPGGQRAEAQRRQAAGSGGGRHEAPRPLDPFVSSRNHRCPGPCACSRISVGSTW